MKQYIGSKLVTVNSKPMRRGAYNDFRGWDLPANENGEDEGYMVERLGITPPNTDSYAGYVSWMPKTLFEESYSASTAISFGIAVEALKQGKSVRRTGWNGSGLWLELKTPQVESEMTLPYIFMCYPMDAKATPGCRVPWLASQTDILTEDWEIVE
jgi:Protein of unknown function (DUF2829)